MLYFLIFGILTLATVEVGKTPKEAGFPDDKLVIDLDTNGVCDGSNSYYIHRPDTPMTAGAGDCVHNYATLHRSASDYEDVKGCTDLHKLHLEKTDLPLGEKQVRSDRPECKEVSVSEEDDLEILSEEEDYPNEFEFDQMDLAAEELNVGRHKMLQQYAADENAQDATWFFLQPGFMMIAGALIVVAFALYYRRWVFKSQLDYVELDNKDYAEENDRFDYSTMQ